LGHQALAVALGGSLLNLSKVFHGVAIPTKVLGSDPLFKGLPNQFATGRYHSWVVNKENLPQGFEITAEDEHGNCMAMRHMLYNLCGVQFHPESILTEHGAALMKNWIEQEN
jgi:anthranilate synthase component 2